MQTAYEKRWWTLGVLSLALVVISLDNTVLNVALPTIAEDLGATSSQLQWIVDAYTLVFAGLLLTAGSLGAAPRCIRSRSRALIASDSRLIASHSGLPYCWVRRIDSW